MTIFAQILFEHGNFQKIDRLILVTFFCFFSWCCYRLVYTPSNHYTHPSFYLYILCEGDEYYVNVSVNK